MTLAPGLRARRATPSINAPEPYAVVLTDLLMPDGNGMDLLALVKQRTARTEVIVMTAHGGVETAIEAMTARRVRLRDEAVRDDRAPRARAEGAREARHRRRERAPARAAPRASAAASCSGTPSRCAASSISCSASRTRARRCSSPGESGTGKERIARAIHDASDRRDKPVPRRQLRRHPRGAHGGGALRPREGRVHRRRGDAAWASSARPTAARCCSTRSASCRPRSR